MFNYWTMINRRLPKNSYLKFFIGALFFSIILPLIFKLPFLTGVVRLIVLLFLINGSFSLLSGFYARKRGLGWLVLLFFPAIFTITSLLIHLVTRNYALFFSIFYFILSLFTFLADNSSDPDEEQIPIDGGIDL